MGFKGMNLGKHMSALPDDYRTISSRVVVMSEMTETYLSLMLAYFSSINSLDRSCQKAQASRNNALRGTAPFTVHQTAISQEDLCAQLSGDPPHEQQPQLPALLVVFLAVETSSS